MDVEGLRRRLLAWYDGGRRELPWRFPQRAADPYRVWIAEVMLQQTRVAAVVPYYERFVARFPTLEALARAREDEVLSLWSGLGYYARARRLTVAARETLRRHGGLPASLDDLQALPGFGPYTAGAVASIAFALPVPAVDGNVTRVLSRLHAVEGSPEAPEHRARIREHAAALARGRRPGDLNQALMELGATVCAPRSPACGTCPVAARCAARAAGREAELPAARRRPARRKLVLACAIFRRNGEILLARRPPDGLFGGLWTPPSFEVAPGAGARRLVDQGLRALGLRCVVGGELAACERALTHRVLLLRAFACAVRGEVPRAAGLRWCGEADWGMRGTPSAMRALLTRIELFRGAQDRESA